MQTIRRERLPWILVTLIVALNITVLTLVWFRPSGGEHPHPPDGPPRPRGGLAGEIGMTPEESLKVEEIQRVHFAKMEAFRDEIVRLRLAAFSGFGEANADTVGAMAALEKIGAVQVAAENERYAHFLAVLAMCTPEEATRFKEILPKILARGNHPESRGRMPQDGGPPHDRPPFDGPPPR